MKISQAMAGKVVLEFCMGSRKSGAYCAAGSPVIENANPWICMRAETNSLNAGGNTDAKRSP